MKYLINSLLLVLLIQCAMVAILYWPDASLMDMINRDRLVVFEPYRVDEIHVANGKDNQAVLLKADDHWVLPDLGGLKVAPELIDKLMSGVLSAPSGWPVASSLSAKQRFHVADYKFERRLNFISRGEPLGTIYLGKSPGLNKVYAKNASHEAIYSIPFNSRDASAINADWLDRRTLQIVAPHYLSFGGHQLNRQGDAWATDAGLAPNEEELQALLRALEKVQIENIADDRTQDTLSIAVPEIQMDIAWATKETTYQLFMLGTKHYIHCSDHAVFFGLSAQDFNRFASLDANRLAGTN